MDGSEISTAAARTGGRAVADIAFRVESLVPSERRVAEAVLADPPACCARPPLG